MDVRHTNTQTSWLPEVSKWNTKTHLDPFDHGLVTMKLTRHINQSNNIITDQKKDISTSSDTTSTDDTSSSAAEAATTRSIPKCEINDDDEFVLWYTMDHWPLDQDHPPDHHEEEDDGGEKKVKDGSNRWCSWRFQMTDLPLMIRFDNERQHDDNDRSNHSHPSPQSDDHRAYNGGSYYLIINRGVGVIQQKDKTQSQPTTYKSANKRSILIWRLQSISDIDTISTNPRIGSKFIAGLPSMYRCIDGSFITDYGNIWEQSKRAGRTNDHMCIILPYHEWSRFQCEPSLLINISTKHKVPPLPRLHIWNGYSYKQQGGTDQSTIMTSLRCKEDHYDGQHNRVAAAQSKQQILSLCATHGNAMAIFSQQWPIHDPHIIALTPLLPHIPISILLRLILDYLMDPLELVTINDRMLLSQLHGGEYYFTTASLLIEQCSATVISK
jgi:hypothetical protein